MALDISKLRKNLKNRTDKKNLIFWKPKKDGEFAVRIFPGKEEDGSDLYFEGGFHRLGESDYFNCPAFSGKHCPMCEESKKKYASEDKEEQKIAGQLRARKQYYYNGIVRSEMFKKDAEGKETDELDIKLIQAGVKIHNKIINGILDEDIGDITDFEKGFDVKIVRKQVSGQNNYDDTEIARKSSPAFEDPKYIEYVKSHFINPEEYQRYLPQDILQKCLDEFLEIGYVKFDYKNISAESKPEDSSSKEKEASSEEKKSSGDEDFPKDGEEKPAPAKEEAKSEGTSEDKETKEDFDDWDKEFSDDIED